MKRPKIPNKKTLRAFSKTDVTKYAALARKWYADEARILAIRDMATATRSFLVENEHTVKNDGQLDNAKPWWPRNY
ncbi:hypothetical protein, partial [Klebsiella aerogenes]|uniref:hypothetical protein n=1 Tax=Klebsiella aerogenes TaxID=548 RepID=UPI0013D707A7